MLIAYNRPRRMNISSLSPSDLRQFRRALLRWYERYRRDLPWRRDADPYKVWVSEIMLQQTRVAAVLDHYERFMRRFPTVQTLARARESSVLAAWSGLGYYHRARRMHRAAKVIVRERYGNFPRTAEDWQALPGIGRYTAGAIASIAFGEAAAVVDGNVERVLDRLFGQDGGREAVWQRARSLLDRQHPGDFNQAMMELGATVCTPRAPQCLLCPLNQWCQSLGKYKRRAPAPRKRKELCYALALRKGSVLLTQRPEEASLMAGLWELPVAPEGRSHRQPVVRLRHSITDTDYRVAVIEMPAEELLPMKLRVDWFARKAWERLPLTGLARKILRKVSDAS